MKSNSQKKLSRTSRSCPSTRSNSRFRQTSHKTASTSSWSPLTKLSAPSLRATPRNRTCSPRRCAGNSSSGNTPLLLGRRGRGHRSCRAHRSLESRFHPHPFRQLSSNSNGCPNLYLAHSARPPPIEGSPSSMERRCTRALSRPVAPAAPFPPPPVRQNRRFGSRSSRFSAAEKPDLGFCRPKPWRRCPVTAKSEEGLPKRRFCRTSGGGNVTALLLPTDASTVSGGMELDPESCAKRGARTDVSRENPAWKRQSKRQSARRERSKRDEWEAAKRAAGAGRAG